MRINDVGMLAFQFDSIIGNVAEDFSGVLDIHPLVFTVGKAIENLEFNSIVRLYTEFNEPGNIIARAGIRNDRLRKVVHGLHTTETEANA